jgi:disulfide bond formation protein DsbB
MKNHHLLAAWLVSIAAMLGSLYFSEIRHFIPCTFCWYQRILMYPLTIIIGTAYYYGDHKAHRYVLPLSVLGMAVSAYHITLQKIPFMHEFEMCTSGVPCSGEYINWLGFITIPVLSFTAFSAITIFMVIFKKRTSQD